MPRHISQGIGLPASFIDATGSADCASPTRSCDADSFQTRIGAGLRTLADMRELLALESRSCLICDPWPHEDWKREGSLA